jgi:hypothetical protein
MKILETHVLNYSIDKKRIVVITNIHVVDTVRSKNYFIFQDYADFVLKIFF